MKPGIIILAMLLAFPACSGKAGGGGEKTPTDEGGAGRTADAAASSLDGGKPSDAGGGAVMTEASVEGTWESLSCGERHYARSITIMKGGGFGMTDLVAPCPAGAKCVWSGIVYYSGTWKIDDGRLKILYGEPQKDEATVYAKPAEGLPGSFYLAGEGEQAELIAEDGKDGGCAYHRPQEKSPGPGGLAPLGGTQ